LHIARLVTKCFPFKGVTLKSLLNKNPTKRFIAGNGGNSHKNRILGESGADITIPVPVGVTVYNDFDQVLGKIGNT
jgi:GTPase involved in cell partitioning and DNA repair